MIQSTAINKSAHSPLFYQCILYSIHEREDYPSLLKNLAIVDSVIENGEELTSEVQISFREAKIKAYEEYFERIKHHQIKYVLFYIKDSILLRSS